MDGAGEIFALDLGVKSGFAIGCPGAVPRSGVVTLKKPGSHRDISFSNLIAFLQDEFEKQKPELVVKEAMLTIEAFKTIGNADATVRLQAGLHAVVEGICVRYGIRWEEATDSTIRKHFIGKGKMGTRDATKRAVVKRCQLLGLMPKTEWDDNRADAIAVHDWACATFARKSITTSKLFLFNETSAGGEASANV